MPESNQVFLLIDTSQNIKIGIPNFENNESYFAVSDFENEGLGNTFLLQPDIFFSFENESGLSLQASSKRKDLAQVFLEAYGEFSSFESSTPVLAEAEAEIQNRFTVNVKEAISRIQKGFFDKVVLSEIFQYSIEHFNPADFFVKIIEGNSHAFVNLICLKGGEIWMGVTPEKLLSKDKDGLIHTVALAATQSFIPNKKPKDATWSGKEIEEQALVSRYIINCFKKLRLREYKDFGPHTVKAGNLLHLKTDFYINTKEIDFPNLATSLLALLHPTSAVCGMPLTSALAFIKDTEKHPRELYCGFIGLINILGESNLFVNLRCLKYKAGQIYFFAGAGITSSSVPDKEYQEIKNKTKILLDFLN